MKPVLLAAITALFPVAALAQGTVAVHDAYARSSNPQAGAAFMMIDNTGDTACQLVAASAEGVAMVELHTHKEVDGVMQMLKVEEGFEIPAGGSHALERGGDHVMLMGLTAPLQDGDVVDLTLDFGDCGTQQLQVPVDNQRKPDAAGMHDHG
ncbi:copper chaperone PCu(A)C [Paracoccus sp. (in: a-proteobacteria)]|uniref:copper chaperone PCu(A)C n=1 Tax=Paracoccus sp. TaxID=267 RepID=UPI003A83E67F